MSRIQHWKQTKTQYLFRLGEWYYGRVRVGKKSFRASFHMASLLTHYMAVRPITPAGIQIQRVFNLPRNSGGIGAPSIRSRVRKVFTD